MEKVIMIYTSQTGNTEMVTDLIADNLQQLGFEVTLKSFEFDVINIDELATYDAVLVGTYTWDDGELPYEAEDFYVDLEGADLSGQVFGVYGSGDTCYDTFGLAIDIMGERLKNLGAMMVPERLKIDLAPNKKDEKSCAAYANSVRAIVQSRQHTA